MYNGGGDILYTDKPKNGILIYINDQRRGMENGFPNSL